VVPKRFARPNELEKPADLANQCPQRADQFHHPRAVRPLHRADQFRHPPVRVAQFPELHPVAREQEDHVQSHHVPVAHHVQVELVQDLAPHAPAVPLVPVAHPQRAVVPLGVPLAVPLVAHVVRSARRQLVVVAM